ncbi:MAG: hypothetical protein QM811_06245 [Pirellulales bacterium]
MARPQPGDFFLADSPTVLAAAAAFASAATELPRSSCAKETPAIIDPPTRSTSRRVTPRARSHRSLPGRPGITNMAALC